MATTEPTHAQAPSDGVDKGTSETSVTAGETSGPSKANASAAVFDGAADDDTMYPNGMHPMLRYCKPYWWPYRTFVKQRWIGRQLLEVVATEFRDRSVEYYRHALESGVTRINGVPAYPEYILRNGDSNTVHRHEPPVSNDPVVVLHVDREKEFCVISKPGSMPVHAAGRYYKHTLLEVLLQDHGIKGYAVNRLDRLTSGLMILALSGPASRGLATEFQEGKVGKEYIARVRGKFPEEEIEVDQPLLTVDRQMGLVIIAPEGKEAKTVFKRMSYDAARDQSVVHCRPLTGRTHQLRVHLQYLGYPIANDPIYASEEAWGPECGRGGVALVDQGDQSSQVRAIAARVAESRKGGTGATPPPVPDDSARLAGKEQGPEVGAVTPQGGTQAREYANIDLTSPIRLSQQARDVIATLRRQRDEAEDWVKWKEVVFATKQAQEKLERGDGDGGDKLAPTPARPKIPHPRMNQGKNRDKAADREMLDAAPTPLLAPAHVPPGFCKECFVPLPDDPDPSSLFIYLHAIRYTTERLGTWATPLPRWADPEWDGDWRGWAGEPPVSVVPPDATRSHADLAAEEDEVERQKADRAVAEAVDRVAATKIE